MRRREWMQHLAGDGPQNRRPRLTLDGWRGRNCSKLGGGEQIDLTGIKDTVARFEAWLWAERNRWSIGHRRLPDDVNAWISGGNLLGGRRLDRADADKLLRIGVAAISGGEVVQ